MPRYVAFLRAINVGGRVVKMPELRAAFVSMGFADAETFIASGNVIFASRVTDPARLERQIEAGLEKALGYPVGTFIRTIEEVGETATFDPFPPVQDDGIKTTVYVILTDGPVAPALKKRLVEFRSETDAFAVKESAIFWRHRGDGMDWPLGTSKADRDVWGDGTMRNRNTMVRLAAKYLK